MRSSRFLGWIASALAVFSQAASADDRPAAAIIDECAQAAPEDAAGLAALESSCPGLTLALEESGDLPLLSVESRERLQAYDLEDLQWLRGKYAQRASERAVDTDTLSPILEQLREPQPVEPPLTLWERIMRWIRAWFDRTQSDPDSWLSRWLDRVTIPEVIWRAVLYGSIFLVIVLALAVIINELRAAGYLQRRSGALEPADPQQQAGSARRETPVDAETLLAEGNAPALLRILVATLVRSGRLRTERNLTHRELCMRAAFDHAEERESFRRVAELAERAVYSSDGIAPEEIKPVAAAARALHQKLSGATA